MSGLTKRLVLMLAVFFSAGVLYSAPAAAQATRTWVSGVGDDVNPCSRTAPCKTFAGAISKTAAGGEIDCLDPGGFGTVTIVKSITIDCRQTMGSILASATVGINVNGADAVVVLRGLSINGAGTTTGTYGVRVLLAKSVTIEDCIITNFAQSSTTGKAVLVAPSAAPTSGPVNIVITNSVLANNGFGGVHVLPTTNVSVTLTVENTQIVDNGADAAILLNTQPAGTSINARIVNTTISGGKDPAATGVSTKAPAGGMEVSIKSSSITDNGAFGIRNSGGNVRVGNTLISGNGTGINNAAGTLVSFSSNMLGGNTTDGAFSSTIPSN